MKVAPDTEAPKAVIRFEDGIYGFESVKEFILLQEEKTQSIWSLQAAGAPYPCLIVVSPFSIFPDYSPVLSEDDLRRLHQPRPEDLCFLAVAVIRRELKNSVVNLKSPVVINVPERIGRQVILEESSYSVRYPLFRNAQTGRA